MTVDDNTAGILFFAIIGAVIALGLIGYFTACAVADRARVHVERARADAERYRLRRLELERGARPDVDDENRK